MMVTVNLKYFIFISILRSQLSKANDIYTQKVSNSQEHVALYWPKGIVTYYFDNLVYDDYIAQRVRVAMNVLETASCVKFRATGVKPAGNMTWIHFTNPRGERNCVHEPKFKEDGEITLVLGFDCLKEHEILHTLLHAIGFKDEVSHPQRDQYIRVMWNNIQPEYRYLYRIRPGDEKTSQMLVEYDPLSIMHFHDRAFSMNGQATVMPLVTGLLISPSADLSQLDKMRLRLLFNHECNKRKVGDMIDTCKMLLSNINRPKGSKNVSKPGLEKKPSESGDAHIVDKVDNVDGVEKHVGIDKGKEIATIEEVNVSMNINNVDKKNINKSLETDSQNLTELKLAEHQNDSDEHESNKALNRLIPAKLTDLYGFGFG